MKKILIAHDLKPQITSAMNFLHRADLALFTATTNEELLKLHIEEHMDLIITRPDLPGMACETVFNIFRRSATLRRVSIFLICEHTSQQRERGKLSGANAVMDRPVDLAALAKKVQDLLTVAPRRSYRVVLSMAVDGKTNGRPFLCSTENVSANGMLIRSTERLVVGTHISCSFFLPDGTRISAAGEVARVVPADLPTDQHRYGVRFLSLAAQMESALSAFVEKETRLHTPTVPQANMLVA